MTFARGGYGSDGGEIVAAWVTWWAVAGGWTGPVWECAQRRPSECRPRLFEVADALERLRQEGRFRTGRNTWGCWVARLPADDQDLFQLDPHGPYGPR